MDQELKDYFDKKFENVVTKDYLDKVLDKRLAKFATKDDLKKFATKKDLEKFPTKADLDQRFMDFAVKYDLANMATKNDISELKTYVDKHITELGNNINDLGTVMNETVAIPLERLIFTLKDYPMVRGDVKRIKRVLHMPD